MEKLKELWKKLNPRVAIIGGVVVISTTLGTCHLMDSEESAPDSTEEAPVKEADKSDEAGAEAEGRE
tara:strand:- start:3256 stop:3456 length:201 start_codon:yes stop_codon:yes gene_type:complete